MEWSHRDDFVSSNLSIPDFNNNSEIAGCKIFRGPLPILSRTGHGEHHDSPKVGESIMLIRSFLFGRGHPLSSEPGLRQILDFHASQVLQMINSISNLSQLTESNCEALIKEALVKPISLKTDQITRETRTEVIEGSSFPRDFYFLERYSSHPRTVVRIVIPFVGDSKLLEFSPSSASLTFPTGEVSGNAIRFDIVLWGYEDDKDRAKREFETNREAIESRVISINDEVKHFNESVVPKLRQAFESKFNSLSEQHAIFDDLGIPEAVPPGFSNLGRENTGSRIPSQSRGKTIILVENMLVTTLNQYNSNSGDVKNAIQSE